MFGVEGHSITSDFHGVLPVNEPAGYITGGRAVEADKWAVTAAVTAAPRSLLALGFFLLAAVAMTWPLLPDAASRVTDYGDPLFQIWEMDWIHRALLTDPSKLYTAPMFHGYPLPLAYDDVILGPALVTLPLSLVAGSAVLSYNLLLILNFALAGFCAFLLARHVTGSAAGGLIAGMLYGFWQYTFAHISHMNMMSLYPLPLALLCLHKLLDSAGARNGYRDRKLGRERKRGGDNVSVVRWGLAFTVCFIWQALHSFYYTAYMGIAAAAMLAWELVIVRGWRDWTATERVRALAVLAASFTVVGAGLAVISAPYRDVRQQLGFYRASAEQREWSAQLTDYLSVSPRNRLYKTVLPNQWPEPMFPGFAVLGLVVAGGAAALASRILRKRSDAAQYTGRREARSSSGSYIAFYALLALSALLLSLGPEWQVGGARLPLPYKLLAALPGFDSLRAPGRISVLGVLGLGVVAAWAWGQIAGPFRRRPAIMASEAGPLFPEARSRTRVVARGALLLMLLGVMLAEQWNGPAPQAPLPPRLEHSLLKKGLVPPAYEWLATQPDDGVVVEFPLIPALQDSTVSYRRIYYQSLHRHPLVNGHSSFIPPTYPEIAAALEGKAGVTPTDIGILQSLEARYLLFHRWSFKRRKWKVLKRSLQTYPEVRYVGEMGDHDVFTLDPMQRAARLQLRWKAPRHVGARDEVPVSITIANPHRYPQLSRVHPRGISLNVKWKRLAAGNKGREGAKNKSDFERETPSKQYTVNLDTPLVIEQGDRHFSVNVTSPDSPGTYRLCIEPNAEFPRYELAEQPVIEVGPEQRDAGSR